MSKPIFLKLKKIFPNLKKGVFLKNYTTFKIGGPAKYFLAVKNRQELIKAIQTANENNLLFFILGGGSNLLVSDRGYSGLVIKIQNKKLKIVDKSAIRDIRILSDAGLALSKLTQKSFENNLTGMEWAVGIPGTVGGAIRGNAGAFGGSMSDIVKTVEVIDIKSESVKVFKNKDCKFKYRESIFKNKQNLIILSIEIELQRGNKKETKEKVKIYLSHRKKQPLEFSSAGSIFKNLISQERSKELEAEIKKDEILQSMDEHNSIATGYIIGKCGLKGERVGNAQISEKHGNFIVNLGGAKAENVLALIDLAKKEVKKKFNTKLEEEIQYLGF